MFIIFHPSQIIFRFTLDEIISYAVAIVSFRNVFAWKQYHITCDAVIQSAIKKNYRQRKRERKREGGRKVETYIAFLSDSFTIGTE